MDDKFQTHNVGFYHLDAIIAMPFRSRIFYSKDTLVVLVKLVYVCSYTSIIHLCKFYETNQLFMPKMKK